MLVASLATIKLSIYHQFHGELSGRRLKKCIMSAITKHTRKTTKRILAIATACIAIPLKPSTAAIRAKIKNNNTKFNINLSLDLKFETKNNFLSYIILHN